MKVVGYTERLTTLEFTRDCSDSAKTNARSEAHIALCIFALSFLYLCLFRKYSWVDPDEGIILQGAQRILDGQVLYRDFFSFFTPGSYYLYALVLRWFGNSLLVAHTAVALIGGMCSPMTYLLAKRVCARQPSLLISGLVTVTALPQRFIVVHNWDSTLLACIALYGAVRFVESRELTWAFVAASFVSLTGMFEQSKGAGLLLGLVAGFAIIVLRGDRKNMLSRRHVLAIIVGLLWPVVIAIIYFASQHALLAMLGSWFWPLQHYSAANQVPYGSTAVNDHAAQALFLSGSIGERLLKLLAVSPRIWVPIVPLFALALFPRLIASRVEKSPFGQDWEYYVLVSASIAGLLLSTVFVRRDYEHFVYLQPIFFIVLAWMVDGRNLRSRGFRRIAPVVGFCLTMSLLFTAALSLFRVNSATSVVTRRGAITLQSRDEIPEFVEANTRVGDRILIYPYESTYYYLTATYSPSGYEYYQPGMHTPQQIRQMLADLEAHPVKLVLYEPSFADHVRSSWPNTPASAMTYDPVGDYLAREYHACRILQSALDWRFVAMVQNGASCP